MTPAYFVRCLLASFLMLGIFVSIAISTNCATTTGSPALAAEGKSSAWLIDQDDRVGGVRTIYASPSGIRIESKQSKVVIVSSPPTWKVATYSDQKRNYYDCPADKFVNILSKPIAGIFGVNLASVPLKKTGPIAKFGITTTAYDTGFPLGVKQFWNQPENGEGTRRLPLTAHALFADSLKLPEAEGAIMVRLYGIPKEPGLPLVFEYNDQDNDLHRHLRCFIVKSVTVPDSMFKVPAGYKRVGTVQEVIRAMDNEDIQNLF